MMRPLMQFKIKTAEFIISIDDCIAEILGKITDITQIPLNKLPSVIQSLLIDRCHIQNYSREVLC